MLRPNNVSGYLCSPTYKLETNFFLKNGLILVLVIWYMTLKRLGDWYYPHQLFTLRSVSTTEQQIPASRTCDHSVKTWPCLSVQLTWQGLSVNWLATWLVSLLASHCLFDGIRVIAQMELLLMPLQLVTSLLVQSFPLIHIFSNS